MLDTNAPATILLVEDDDALRQRLAKALEKRGYVTLSASGVADAKDVLRHAAPRYAVVDLRLLDGSGLDVIEELERRDSAARGIILTGYGDIPTAVAAAKIGATDYLAKPATADEIIDALMTPKGERPPAPAQPMSPDAARLEHIDHFYQQAGENVSQAARLLNMHRRTLQRILRRHEARDRASD